ncbi:DUF4446 family protein [Nocardioides insulae]|uniref:DUF4446 family protein n=1 Tax=Nocardioides insulae TaxID=394734 RepID=UPI0004166143|nr:DUF4446 family protein [Nocardioides insulae]
MALVVGTVGVVFGVLALVVAVSLLGRVRRSEGRVRPSEEGLPSDVLGLRQEVAALRAEGAQAMRHLAVVRYDAFGDMGGHLSWSLALLDDRGSGLLLTSIHGRGETRTYAKTVLDWSCDQQVSPEEEEALSAARPAA